MQSVELFSGHKSFSNAASALGISTFTVDFDKSLSPDLCIDILNLRTDQLPSNINILWASIDFTAFSIASGGKYFHTVESIISQEN